MITDQTALGRIVGQWVPGGLFDSKWANLIGDWCATYFKKYQKAPGIRISRLFELWSQKNTTDEKTVEAIEHFLQSLSDDHQEVLSDHILDLAGAYFQKVRIKAECDAALIELDNGLIDQADERLRQIRKVNLGVGSSINVATDSDAWHRAYNQQLVKPLVTYAGDLGKFTDGAFTRGSFYAFLAPDKTGKTTWLLDFAYRAIRQRNQVIYFDMGDSIEEEVMLKLGIRASAKPEFDSVLKFPVDWNGTTPKIIECKEEASDEYLAKRMFNKVCSLDDGMKISCHLNSSMTVRDIDSILTDYERQGWRPDVVVIDYADILARPRGILDKIEAIDENWKALRRLSQQRHCLVMTATQSKATGYSKTESLLGPEDFSGSKSKNAHVNGILGINVSPGEKEVGAARINWPVRRKRASSWKWFCRVAGCIAIGNPAIISKDFRNS